ncbi:MAG: MFS transporter [Nitrososphaeraceae archaeon]
MNHWKREKRIGIGIKRICRLYCSCFSRFITGYMASAYGLKPYPFYLGITFPILGLLISLILVKDTTRFTQLKVREQSQVESQNDKKKDSPRIEQLKEKGDSSSSPKIIPNPKISESSLARSNLNFRQVFFETSWKNRSLLAANQAGLVNNMIFGVTWGMFTLYFVSFGINVSDTSLLKALHPGIWGILQLGTGPLSDIVGRKKLIYPGMIVQAIGIWIILLSQSSYAGLITGMSMLGIGTALVYPTLLAAISDIAHPNWRATSLGVYRFWRDLGFVFGAVGIGFIADIFNLNIAIQAVAWISLVSAAFVFVFMQETRHRLKL